jgi:small redox-active disulfide protein 2
MITIKVLGPGCANCVKVADVANKAVASLGAQASIEKVTDFAEIRKYKILATPGLVINEKVVCAARIPTLAEVTTWMTNAMAAQE